ncbi:MAG: hypothetical protein LJE93_10630 [Acidobacteria bacterium]|jgi:hypothetical protein|nr:hypothetical protein [Acidobacteriota bacterium]
MRIAYFEPLTRAWERMKLILWRPFDLAKWLVLGFSCWLAGLADGAGGGGWKWIVDEEDFPGRFGRCNGWMSHEEIGNALVWLPLAFILIMAIAAILVLVLWVSSRAKFIYLDNVVHNRAEIVEPWNRLRTLGNSLFLWRIGFIVVCGLVAMVLLLVFFAPAATFSFTDALAGLSYAAMIFGVIVLICFGIIAGFVALMLEAFVIPIMYKFDLKATEAWNYLLPWLKYRPGHFVLYALLVLGLVFVFAAIFAVVCMLTCCVVALPYVGTVILLPLWVTYRIWSVEFLTQFDPEFDLFTMAELPAAAE